MSDWYYHEPGQGRVGPLSADEMRVRFRDRRIAHNTLAWHEGLREWQPLGKLLEELGLTGVKPDTSKPPPVPVRPAAATASHAGPMRGQAAPPQSNRSGCIIAVVVIAVVGLFLIGILAAIAIPAYQDYVERAKAAQALVSTSSSALQEQANTFDPDRMADTDASARELVTMAMREFYTANNATCPDTYEFETLQVRHPRLQGSEDSGWFDIASADTDGSQCAYVVSFLGLGAEVQDKTVRYEVTIAGDTVDVACQNIDLPPDHAPSLCGG